MRIEAEIKTWIPPRSTNTEPTYYKSVYRVTGSFFELDDFQRYIDNYNPNKSINRTHDKAVRRLSQR